MKNVSAIFALTVSLFSLLALGCASTGTIPPKDDYRHLDCAQYARLMDYTLEQTQHGQTPQQIYDAITPSGASVRTRLLHAISITEFTIDNPVAPQQPSTPEQTQQWCTEENVVEYTENTINNICIYLEDKMALLIDNMRNSSQTDFKDSGIFSETLYNRFSQDFEIKTGTPLADYPLFDEQINAIINNIAHTSFAENKDLGTSEILEHFRLGCQIDQNASR